MSDYYIDNSNLKCNVVYDEIENKSNSSGMNEQQICKWFGKHEQVQSQLTTIIVPLG